MATDVRLWILSDLHIDQPGGPIDLGPHPEHDFIIVAGDLCDGDFDPVPWLTSTFSEDERWNMIYVPGNHDYYGVGFRAGQLRLDEIEKDTGINILDFGTAEIDGQRFVGATLWSNFKTPERSYGMLGDFSHIQDFSPEEWCRRHAQDLEYLRHTVQPGDVVITHHAPSRQGLDARMQHDPRLMPFASGYASDLDGLVGGLQPALWVHGHTHITREYVVGGVPVVSNALGRGAGLHFRPDYVVEIGGYEPNLRAF